MKKIYIPGLIIALIMISFSCEKLSDPAGQRDVGVVTVISDQSGILINGADNSSITFTVGTDTPTSFDNAEIVVSHQNSFERMKIADITSFPSTFTFTLSEVISALNLTPADVHNGDVFYFETVVTKDGITTRSNGAFNTIVLCEFDPALTSGSYHSVSPPTDWASEGNIKITSDPNDPYTVYVTGLEEMEGLVEQDPLVMHIDPATFAVTADPSVISLDAWGFGSITYSGTGQFNSCDGSYIMSFDIELEALGDQGLFSFTFTRNM